MKKDETTKSVQPAAGRRRLLKALTAGGAAAAVVPAEWTKPLVKGAMLPAHAQTTPTPSPGPGPGPGPTPTGNCIINFADGGGGGGSLSVSVDSKAAPACAGSGGSATLTVTTGGFQLAKCTSAYNGTVDALSWSCSTYGPTGGIYDDGDDITFLVEWDGGCVCQVIKQVGD